MTNTRYTLFLVPTAALMAVLAVVLSYQAGAQAAGQVGGHARPTAVAVVDLPRVVEGLEQRKAAEANLEKLSQDISAEARQHEEQIEAARTVVDAAPTDDVDQRLEAESQLIKARLDYQAWRQYRADEMDLERALMLQDLYRSIRDAAENLAASAGYDVVLIDDSSAELTTSRESQAPREAQVMAQLSERRILYRSDAVDITDELVVRMNNAFLAGR